MKRSVQLAFALVGATLGYHFGPAFFELLRESPLKLGEVPAPHYIGALLGALLLYVATIWLSGNVVRWIRWSEERLVKIPAADFLFGALGLILGLIVAFLIESSLSRLPLPGLSSVLPILASALLGYLGFRVGYKKRDELMSVFTMGVKTRIKRKNPRTWITRSWTPA